MSLLQSQAPLNLACALEAKAQGIVTLDTVMTKNAKRLKLKSVAI